MTCSEFTVIDKFSNCKKTAIAVSIFNYVVCEILFLIMYGFFFCLYFLNLIILHRHKKALIITILIKKYIYI